MKFTQRAKRDERGAVLILSVGGLILALIASALAVDLGRQANEKKSDQIIADLAALDAARELEPLLLSLPGIDLAVTIANVQQAAEASAERNGFDLDEEGNDVVAEVGSVDAQNQFTPGGTSPDAVKVTVTSVIPYVFDMGERTLDADAIAKMASGSSPPTPGTDPDDDPGSTIPGNTDPSFAGFDLGSALASFDPDEVNTHVPLMNRVIGRMIGGNADVVSWKGLGNANVALSGLRQELANMGYAVGTPQELMAADLTLRDLFQATANVLNQQGTSEAAAAANLFGGSAGIIAQAQNQATFKLAEIMTFNQGAGDTVADANMKVLDMVWSSAQAANGDNVIRVDDTEVDIDKTSNTAMELQIVEPMQHVFGPVGTSKETAQIRMTVIPTINRAVAIPGLNEPTVTGNFPFLLESAGAKGTVGAIDCVANNLTVGVDTRPVTGSGSASLQVDASLPLVGKVPVVQIPYTAAMPTIAEKHTDLGFLYNTEFHPNSGATKRAGTVPLEIEPTFTPGSINVLRTITASADDIVDAVTPVLDSVMAEIEDQIINPFVRDMGLTMGVAEITATDMMCGATQPPTSIPPGPGTPGTPPTPGSGSGPMRPILVG